MALSAIFPAACSSVPAPESVVPVVAIPDKPVAPPPPPATPEPDALPPAAPEAAPEATPEDAEATPSAAVEAPPVTPGRASAQSVMEAFFQAAEAHQLQAMLDCFTSAGRKAESAGKGSLSKWLARPGVTLGPSKAISTSTTMVMRNGNMEGTAVHVRDLTIQEGGRSQSKTFTFRHVLQNKEWFLTEIREGKPPAPPGGSPFDIFGTAP